ncbi:MAG: TolC family protein [Bacteroidetes bacterium]|nr:TolC family protein [Bacteroidota bacterium]
MRLTFYRGDKIRVFLSILFICSLPLAAQQLGEAGSSGLGNAVMAASGVPVIYYETDLYKAAVSESREIAELMVQIEKSRLDVQNAKAGQYPDIDLTVSGTFVGNPMDAIKVNPDDILSGIDWPSGFSPDFSGGAVTLFPGQESTYYRIGLELTQPLFTWGKITDSIRIYEDALTINILQTAQKQEELKPLIQGYLCSLHYLNLINQKINEQKGFAARLLEITERSYESGFIVYEDVLQAQIAASEIDIVQLEIFFQQQKLLTALQNLTGVSDLSIDQIGFVPDENTIKQMDTQSIEVLLRKALDADRTIFKIFSRTEVLQGRALTIAENSVYWKPDFALKMDVGYEGPRVPFAETDWFRKDDYSLNLTVAVKTTIWDGGKLFNDIESKILETAGTEEARKTAEYEISSALRSETVVFQVNKQRLEYDSLLIENAERQAAIKKLQFDGGVGMEVDYIRAQIEIVSQQINQLEDMMNLCISYYTIRGITGE